MQTFLVECSNEEMQNIEYREGREREGHTDLVGESKLGDERIEGEEERAESYVF